jgi:deoxyribonuclease V
MHPWNLTVEEAEVLQKSLAEDCSLEGDPEVETVAGVDISMNPDSELAITTVVLYSLERRTTIKEIVLLGDLTFPYVPGLLAFREAPLMLQALMRLDREPDCLIVDGHGYAHPRRFGLASHLGLLMELPSIGCAKSLLVGDFDTPGSEVGSFTDIWDGEPIGYAFRSRKDANPIFLSAGHKISRENMLPIVRQIIDGRTKLPAPVHRADKLAGNERKRLRTLSEPFIDRDLGVFLVGGALRDLLSGRQPADYDLLVTDFDEEIREEIGDRYESNFFEMDADRQVFRMVAENLQLDVTVVENDQVVDDLLRRDFTINSIALDMNRENWVDPCSGRDDIKQGKIRPTEEDSMWEDPVRLLRAFRFASDLDFELTDEVTDQVEEIGPRLSTTSYERIVEELFKIVSLEESLECLSQMKGEGVFRSVDFFRGEGVGEVRLVTHWVPILEGYELFSGDYHGEYELLTGLQVGRLIAKGELDGWPIHDRIKRITRASYESLTEVPDFDVLNSSQWSLVGRLLGMGLRENWSSHRVGETLSRLQRYVRDRDLLEKDIVEDIREQVSEDGNIGERKRAKLKTELPGLWENRMTPILSTRDTVND